MRIFLHLHLGLLRNMHLSPQAFGICLSFLFFLFIKYMGCFIVSLYLGMCVHILFAQLEGLRLECDDFFLKKYYILSTRIFFLKKIPILRSLEINLEYKSIFILYLFNV